MTVRVYFSTDTSAPVIAGTVGSYVDALDAILVNGYGSQTAAGWTKPYTGTAGAVFRPGAGLQYYYNVNDNGPGVGTYKEARVVGYETMSAFATGTNLFPTAAQMANGAFVRKSVTADATARAWVCVADERTFYISIATGDVASQYFSYGFGEIYSFKASDPGRTFICARSTENIATATLDTLDMQSTMGLTLAGNYLARDTAGSAGAIIFGRIGDISLGAAGATIGTIAYKNASDNRIYLAPMRAHHAVGGIQIRGRMRGLWHFGHPLAAASDRDTITGTGSLAGKTFLVIKQGGNGGFIVYETSNTWSTN